MALRGGLEPPEQLSSSHGIPSPKDGHLYLPLRWLCSSASSLRQSLHVYTNQFKLTYGKLICDERVEAHRVKAGRGGIVRALCPQLSHFGGTF